MEALPMATAASIKTIPLSHIKFCEFKKSRSFLCFRTKPRRKICAFSANNSGNNNNNAGKLDKWDQMELKFGQMMGEDPNLTRAKIMGRKIDPNISYLEVEKMFYNKGKPRIIEEVPFDVSDEKKPSGSLNGLNLVRPVLKKGLKFEVDTKPIKSKKINVPNEVAKKPVNTRGAVPNVILRKPRNFNEDDIGLNDSSKMNIKPNLLLRMGREQTKENFTDMTLLLKKPEPMISNSNIEKEQELSGETKVEDMTLLLKKPEPVISNSNIEKEKELSGETKAEGMTLLLQKPEPMIKPNIEKEKELSGETKGEDMTLLLKKPEPMINSNIEKEQELFGETKVEDMTLLLKKPEPVISNSNIEKEKELSGETKAEATNDLTFLSDCPQLKQVDIKNNDGSSDSYDIDANLESSERRMYADPEGGESVSLSRNSASDDLFAKGPQQSDAESTEEPSVPLIGKPNRLDQNAKVNGNLHREHSDVAKTYNYRNDFKLESSATSSLPIKEHEENDWRRVEDLIQTSGRDDVELVSASTRGFVVSFGSLIGFLPYRNLSPRWKFLAFESWLRKKGLDPSKYKQNLGIIGNNGILDETSLDPKKDQEIDIKIVPEISPDMGLDDLLRIYDQEKVSFLSSFVGQKLKVNVTLADRKTRRLIFSLKPKEKEEMVDKKRTLMTKLSVGDVVKCQIKKITYFGIFVEVEEVPALIHQTEVSWDATLDPAAYFKMGQILEAKVHQLDFSLGRIFLSLKEIMPDPLIEALEAVIDDKNYLEGKLEPAQDDVEWVDVESLIKELQQFKGIESVSKGRFFLSPGLAPTFQVYMASMFENEYKLLARAGNKVQEVIVQTSLSKEDMKSAILTCTNRV